MCIYIGAQVGVLVCDVAYHIYNCETKKSNLMKNQISMEVIIMCYENVIKGNMLLLPYKVTKMLASVDVEEILSDVPDGKEFACEVQEMLLKCEFYRIPLKMDVMIDIYKSYEEFIKKHNDISVMDRIIKNRDKFIAKYSEIYDEEKLFRDVSQYVSYEMGQLEHYDEAKLLLNEIVKNTVLAIFADYCIAGYGMGECFDSPAEWARLWG